MVSRRREELLDQLVALFLAEGFRHFTLDDLSARLHCSKSTLYTLGQTKDQVTVDVVRRFFRTATGQVESAIADRRPQPASGSPATCTRSATRCGPASAAFMADLAAHAFAREIYEQNTAIAARRVGELIAAGVSTGEFRPVHAAFVADTAAATMARIQSRRRPRGHRARRRRRLRRARRPPARGHQVAASRSSRERYS